MSSGTTPTRLSADDPTYLEKGLNRKQASSSQENGPEQQTFSESEKQESKLVTSLDASDDPKQRPILQRWIMVLIICASSLCVTFSSSVVCLRFLLYLLILIVSISLFRELKQKLESLKNLESPKKCQSSPYLSSSWDWASVHYFWVRCPSSMGDGRSTFTRIRFCSLSASALPSHLMPVSFIRHLLYWKIR